MATVRIINNWLDTEIKKNAQVNQKHFGRCSYVTSPACSIIPRNKFYIETNKRPVKLH